MVNPTLAQASRKLETAAARPNVAAKRKNSWRLILWLLWGGLMRVSKLSVVIIEWADGLISLASRVVERQVEQDDKTK